MATCKHAAARLPVARCLDYHFFAAFLAAFFATFFAGAFFTADFATFFAGAAGLRAAGFAFLTAVFAIRLAPCCSLWCVTFPAAGPC